MHSFQQHMLMLMGHVRPSYIHVARPYVLHVTVNHNVFNTYMHIYIHYANAKNTETSKLHITSPQYIANLLLA